MGRSLVAHIATGQELRTGAPARENANTIGYSYVSALSTISNLLDVYADANDLACGHELVMAQPVACPLVRGVNGGTVVAVRPRRYPVGGGS